jgi:succinate dehydrogenase / fumarate reductase cytochrome b subunit
VVSPAAGRPGPILRRAFSLSGVVPLGAFLLVHVAVVASALGGIRSLAATEDGVGRLPALGLLEVVFVYVPLMVHGSIGAWLAASRTPAASPSPYPRAIASAMRWTGVALLVFLVLHILELRLRGGHAARLDGGSDAAALVADLSSTWRGVPWWGLAYLTGTACVAFHFAVGLWGFFASTARGRARPEARRKAAWAAAFVAIAMWATLADVTVLHATGRALVGAGTPPDEPCPSP